MTQRGAVFGKIRLKSSGTTFSGTEFVYQKTSVKNRSIYDMDHAARVFGVRGWQLFSE
jgi:hypothetical protein